MTPSSSGIAEAVLALLNSWDGRPCDITAERYAEPSPSPAMRMRREPLVSFRGYCDGNAVLSWRFAVDIRVLADDGDAANAAAETLNALADRLCTGEPPTLAARTALGIALLAQPERKSAAVSGIAEFTARFELRFM